MRARQQFLAIIYPHDTLTLHSMHGPVCSVICFAHIREFVCSRHHTSCEMFELYVRRLITGEILSIALNSLEPLLKNRSTCTGSNTLGDYLEELKGFCNVVFIDLHNFFGKNRLTYTRRVVRSDKSRVMSDRMTNDPEDIQRSNLRTEDGLGVKDGFKALVDCVRRMPSKGGCTSVAPIEVCTTRCINIRSVVTESHS